MDPDSRHTFSIDTVDSIDSTDTVTKSLSSSELVLSLPVGDALCLQTKNQYIGFLSLLNPHWGRGVAGANPSYILIISIKGKCLL